MKHQLTIDCTIGYPGKILDTVREQIHEGEYCIITGSNGAGKSTLMATILGKIPAIKGFIENTFEHMVYVPQMKHMNDVIPVTVKEVITSGRKIDTVRLRSVCSTVHFEDVNANFTTLSGGQIQRVLLARALYDLRGHDLLLLDEPNTGLDPESTSILYHVLDQLHKSGYTILMITHDTDVICQKDLRNIYVGKREERFVWD